MAIVLVEQYFDFAKELADRFVVMDRGEVVMSGTRETMAADEAAVRAKMTV
jgi:urea transport system ATP-binding protein